MIIHIKEAICCHRDACKRIKKGRDGLIKIISIRNYERN